MTADLRARVQAALAGSFTLHRELGGGMSRVFVARERALDRDVVVKVLPPELAADVNMERFKREVQLAARLQHPNITPLLTAGEVDGLAYFTMPVVAGESLRTRIDREGALSFVDTIRILHGVADALAFAHDAGIVHRDIKPENILLIGQHALVTDFGVAKALTSSAAWDTVLAARHIAVGTPAYMAPEQAAANPKADHRADLYSFGVVAYECLTGRPPFTGASSHELMMAHLSAVPEPVAQVRPDVPAALAALVMRCLAKRAEDRPASAQVLLQTLDIFATPILGTPAVPEPDTRRRMLAVVVLLAVGATLLVGALALLASNRP